MIKFLVASNNISFLYLIHNKYSYLISLLLENEKGFWKFCYIQ